jgi:hypothetical protein
LASYAAESIGLTEPDGTAPELNTVEGFYSRGLLDHAVSWATGADVLVGERISTGGMVEQIFRDIIGDGEFGEASALSMLGGATGSIWWDMGGDMGNAIKYLLAEQGQSDMPMTRDSLLRLANNVSTFGNISKAYMIHRYGLYVSSDLNPLASGLPDEYAFAAILSYKPAITEQTAAGFDYLDSRKELVDDLAGTIKRYQSLMITDVSRAPEYTEQLGLIMQLYEPDIQNQARTRAGNDFIPALAESIERSVQRRRLQQSIAEASPTAEENP